MSSLFLFEYNAQTVTDEIAGQKQDDRKSFQRIPESFDKLVKEKDPLSAVRTVVGLLMPAS